MAQNVAGAIKIRTAARKTAQKLAGAIKIRTAARKTA